MELSPEPEKNKGRGRPKGALTEAAKKIGINEQRVFEVRQLRDANPTLYREVKAGNRSLNSALAEISPSRETGSFRPDLDNPEPIFRKPDYGARECRRRQDG
jgi:hypothetical protein